MARRTTVFFAYPSSPPALGETLVAAIASLRSSRGIRNANVQFKPWPAIEIAGKQLAATVMQNIDRAQVFACDLTYPNCNVAFELGYALGSFKRVWVTLDSAVDRAEQEFKRLYFNLIGLGYAPYTNSNEIASTFELKRPWDTLEDTILPERFRLQQPRPEIPTLLYMRPPIDTQSVVSVQEALEDTAFGEGLIVDDPRENPSASLGWYAEKLTTADGIVVHLLSDEQVGRGDHNVKASLIAGLAMSLKRPTLMVVQSPFAAPMDYEHLLNVHGTAAAAVTAVRKWTDQVGNDLPRRRLRRASEPIASGKIDIRNVSIGEPVAEHERFTIDEYFVETQAYYRALEQPTTILVGRRGAGKTAILYAIQAAGRADRRDHVTVIKPVGYEIEGLVRVLDELVESSERGYLVASLWKYVIYSELANSVWDSLSQRPSYQQLTEDEQRFVQYYETHVTVLRMPFSERIDSVVRELAGVGAAGDALAQRRRISEVLHLTFLAALRQLLGLAGC